VAVSGRLALLLALGIIPVVLTGSGVTMAYWLGFVALMTGVDLARAGSPRSLFIERVVPGPVRLGESVESTVLLTNSGSRTVRGIARDAWPPSAGGGTARHSIRIPAGERRAITTTLTPFRRGVRHADAVTVRSFGPLGIAARQASITATGSFAVLPAFTSRKHLPSRLARLRELDGATPIMLRGHGTEFDSLRDYVRGDDVRSIDWRATARSGAANGTEATAASKLVVRTWRPERDRRVVIVIDSGRSSAARIDNEPRLDTAFESALLLASLASRAGDRVDTVIYDRRVRGHTRGASGSSLVNSMVSMMAPIEPELLEPDWAAVPGLVRSITPHRALVVIATSIDAPGASRGLLAMLPQLTRQHVVVVASVTDPSVVETTRHKASRDEIYRAAAAERALLDTSRVAAAVRQLGGEVVTAAPPDLPPELADTYIALKAAGRL
jgi:uncharacterized protein (DUF58 family)